MEEKGFLPALFDIKFESFITVKILSVLYVIAIVGSGLAILAAVITQFLGSGIVAGIITLILSPIFFFLYVLLARIWLELIAVIFRIADNTAKMAEK